MSREPTIHDVAEEVILSSARPLPDSVVAHVMSCASCRALMEAHAAASSLGGLPVPPTAPVAMEAVVRRVRLRRWARLLPAAAAVLVIVSLHARTPAPETLLASTELSLGNAMTTVDRMLYRDVVTEDELYASFSPLPTWLAPPGPRPWARDSTRSGLLQVPAGR